MGLFEFGVPWNHNAHYQRLLLRHVPVAARRVLDVGCGGGELASTPAERVPDNVRCLLGDVREFPLSDGEYDAIVSNTALHHVPLDETLPCLAAALRPGGVPTAVALPRVDLPREIPIEAAAVAGHFVLGPVMSRRYPNHPRPDMPIVLDVSLTTRQVRNQVAALLPGSTVRRLTYWRYFLHWRKPM